MIAKKNTKITILLSIIIILLGLCAMFISVNIDNKTVSIAYAVKESATCDIPNENDMFDHGCVIVIMKSEASGVNKKHDKTIFKNSQIRSVEELSYISNPSREELCLNQAGYQQILKLNLYEESKNAVIRVINELKDNELISWVGASTYETISYDDSSNENVISPMSNIGHRYDELWGLHGNNGINAPSAWNITVGNSNVKVGIIDSGISDHMDLRDNLVEGWDFVNDNNITTDDAIGHGTHVAGIIGATRVDNRISVSGVCKNVQLIPLQVTQFKEGKYTISETAIVEAIYWAIENNVDIINYSIGAYQEYEPIKVALKSFYGLFVCSAGNDSVDTDSMIHYASEYSRDEALNRRVISVGAINSSGNCATFSNYGRESVSIFAPGESIWSTVPQSIASSGYQVWDGTSMAAPFVTGVAALMFSMYREVEFDLEDAKPLWDITKEIKEIILKTAVYGASLNGKCVSNGRLDAFNAVKGIPSFKTTILGDGSLQINGFKYNNNYRDVIIPKTINGRTITAIGNGAFANQPELQTIKLPSTIKSIGANAFEGCSQFHYCTIPNDGQLETIGNSAFYNTNLSHIKLPQSLISIGANAFSNCKMLALVTFQGGSVTIGNAAFSGSKLLVKVQGFQYVKSVGANAFENCTGLNWVESGEETQLTTIENSAFAGCERLRNFVMPTTLVNVGYFAFSGCTALETVVIPDSVTTIGGGAFDGCSNLTIYTSRANTPSGWVGSWNSLNRPIVLSCALLGDAPYVTSFTKSASNPFNANAENGLKNPYRLNYDFDGWYATPDFSGTRYETISDAPNGTIYVKWLKPESCIAEGTLITLADGTQKPVEQLTGDEMLLVWNLQTGAFDVAPILFVDKDPRGTYEVINLAFSDGTAVKVISEHAFWDFDLNKYVYLDENASEYIGHWFNKQTTNEDGSLGYTRVQLVGVEVKAEQTCAYSPVTYSHLCYYVNGMLSMPGGIFGLFNIFEVDEKTMRIDEQKMQEDIEVYGLYTYEEFASIVPVSPEVFEAFNGQYLKVAIGKGMITIERLQALVERYSEFFV